jgi:hypothetical protein
MKTNANAVVAAVLCAAVSLGAVGCGKKSSGGTDDDPGTVLGNAIVLSMAKDQYAKAKAAYDSGGDAAGECIMDTAELRKDKSAEAQKLANDIDTLCDVNVPAKDLEARLKTELADVTTERAGKGEMLAADQVVLQGTCDDIDAALKDMAAKNLATQPGATALKTQRDAACTPDNLTGGAQKQARRK